MALLIFLLGKWIVNKIVRILGKVLRKINGIDLTLVKFWKILHIMHLLLL